MEENVKNGENQNNEQNAQEQNNKIIKNFNANIERLVKIVGGEENISAPKKIGNDVLAKLTNGLLKGRREALEKEVTAELTTILDKKVALDKEFKVKEEELAKLKQQKMKEFNDAAAKVFAKIESIDKLGDDYYNTLKAAGNGGEANATEEKK